MINLGIRLNFNQFKGEMILIMKRINLCRHLSEKEAMPTEMTIVISTIINLEGIMSSIIIAKEIKEVVVTNGAT